VGLDIVHSINVPSISPHKLNHCQILSVIHDRIAMGWYERTFASRNKHLGGFWRRPVERAESQTTDYQDKFCVGRKPLGPFGKWKVNLKKGKTELHAYELLRPPPPIHAHTHM